ncbi:hypothetical protein ABEB36_005923 [Hypothenemus hampei]|uniref:Uncharacterized protein n=1 Tax=Hypothenemus hampei TaxID=57062 RepID=A0ABD1EZW3_HYPHA
MDFKKDKSRGIKHLKDKKKYKGNSIKDPKHVPPMQKPKQLDSNWDRYEDEEENEHEHKLSSSTNFSLLANAPVSSGSHFQFKSDKENEEIFKIKENFNENNLFSLNLDLLHKSMLTIPYYERQGIEMGYFTESEIKDMDKTAAQYLVSYEDYMRTIYSQKKENSDCLKKNEADALKAIQDCSLENNSPANQIHVEKTNSQNDLEQWLDDILDD